MGLNYDQTSTRVPRREANLRHGPCRLHGRPPQPGLPLVVTAFALRRRQQLLRGCAASSGEAASDICRVLASVEALKKVRKGKTQWGMVTSRRALDAALVLDDPATRGVHFLYERDPMPTCAHVA